MTSRVRTKTIKKAAKAIINEYEMKLSKHDFQTNKHVVQEFINRQFEDDVIDEKTRAKKKKTFFLAENGPIKPGPQTKKLRNKIAGLITHYMRRNDLLDKGLLEHGREVKGIKLAVREEQRERRENYQPEVSDLDPSVNQEIQVDQDTAFMLEKMGFEKDDKGNIEAVQAFIKKEGSKVAIPMVHSRNIKKK